jgi:hypothetical protein
MSPYIVGSLVYCIVLSIVQAMRLSKLWLLAEDITEAERMDDRGEEVYMYTHMHI